MRARPLDFSPGPFAVQSRMTIIDPLIEFSFPGRELGSMSSQPIRLEEFGEGRQKSSSCKYKLKQDSETKRPQGQSAIPLMSYGGESSQLASQACSPSELVYSCTLAALWEIAELEELLEVN